MCGIFGIVNFNGDAIDKNLLSKMSSKMIHRGPDDDGIIIENNVGIGMRRLSIIDIEGGHQPISNIKKNIHLVLNGEIYNFKELRKELKSKGYKFSTKSDVEVLIYLYEEEGIECIKKINGMFAFILFDELNNIVWIARDRLGVKPLYYSHNSERIIFGSDLLSVNSILDQSVDEESILLYLGFSYIPAPKTIFKKIYKLMPAEQILIKGNSIEFSSYWDIEKISEVETSKQKSISSLQATLEKSITMQTRSDVPVGLFLSGGVDSSAIAMLMKETRPNNALYTFTVDYVEKDSDDLKYANLIANKIGSNHSVISVTKKDQIKALKDLIPFMDEPVSDSAAISTYIISKKAKDIGVKVLLSGAGGDEIFGGYSRFFNNKFLRPEWIASLPKPMKMIILAPLLLMNKALFWRLKTFENNYIYSISGVNISLLKRAISNNNYNYLINSFSSLFKFISTKNVYSRMKLDLKDYLPNNILSITDKATMATSIEGRVPFLDHDLVELAFSLPEKINLKDGEAKGLFKEAIKDKVPKEILTRKKDGFGAPIYSWIESWKIEIENELTQNLTNELKSIIDISEIKKWIKDDRLRVQSAETLYAIFVLNLWIRRNTL